MLGSTIGDTELFRARSRRFGLLGAALVGLIWVVWLLVQSRGDSELATESGFFGVAALAFLGLWASCQVQRSYRLLRIAETAAFLVASTSIAALATMVTASGFAVAGVVLTLTYLAVLRAIIIPSSGRHSAAVTAVVGLPLVVATAIELDQRHLQLAPYVIGTAAWWVVTTCLVAATSYLTFGLRRDSRMAKRLGQYVIERKIGEGAMGVVYRARHAMLKRPTALKLLSPRISEVHTTERFEREVQLASQLNHPNTVKIYDYGVAADGTFYYAMELLDGVSLSEIVESEGPQPPERVAFILSQVAGSLAEAHANGLIHRDIKPNNILLCAHGGLYDMVKVVDFGLVKQMSQPEVHLTGANTLVGTPMYMPPEAVTAPDTYDGRGDLYALGLVGYYLLAGRTPFDGDNVVELLSAQIHETPVPPSAMRGEPIPEDLEALILDLLRKDPEDRPATADEVRRRLEACQLERAWSPERAEAWWHEYHDRRNKCGEQEPERTSCADETVELTPPLATVLQSQQR